VPTGVVRGPPVMASRCGVHNNGEDGSWRPEAENEKPGGE
jgi:hypothetical protein